MGVHKFELDENEAILAKIYPQYFINFIKIGKPDEGEHFPFRLVHFQIGNHFTLTIIIISL